METIRERAKEQLPMVLLTLLSIVQALALEWLWSHISSRDDIYSWTLPALASWLQIAATQLGIILIWLAHSMIVMRFRWVPRAVDSLFPFLIGIMQFFMIESMGPETFGPWFLLLAATYAIMTIGTHSIMRRARHDKENAVFFENLQPATLKDFRGEIVSILGFTILGTYLWISANEGWVAAIALLVTVGVLGHLTIQSATYWDQSMRTDPANDADSEIESRD